MQAKNYDTAILEMHKVAKMDQRISGPWVNMGVAYKELGDTKNAKACIRKSNHYQSKQSVCIKSAWLY